VIETAHVDPYDEKKKKCHCMCCDAVVETREFAIVRYDWGVDTVFNLCKSCGLRAIHEYQRVYNIWR
jgi:hypothetical protein